MQRTNKEWQSGLGVKKCNEMHDTCSVRSARHPCEISRNAILLYVAHGRCRPIPLPAVRCAGIGITITTTVITAMASLSATVQFIPAAEEEWQVVSVTSGRIMMVGRRWHDGGILRGPFCARPGMFFVLSSVHVERRPARVYKRVDGAGRARWSASQYHNNAAIKYTRLRERDSVRARALTLVVTKEKWRIKVFSRFGIKKNRFVAETPSKNNQCQNGDDRNPNQTQFR